MFVGKKGFGHEHAVVGKLVGGHLHWNTPGEPGRLTFDMRTFAADTSEARRAIGLTGETDADTQRQVNENMLGPAVLHVAKFPVAELVVQGIEPGPPPQDPSAGEAWVLRGDFTLHGVARPLRVPVMVRRVDGLLHVRGRFAIKQTDYGIKPFSKAFGAVGVTDELVIWGDLRVVPDGNRKP